MSFLQHHKNFQRHKLGGSNDTVTCLDEKGFHWTFRIYALNGFMNLKCLNVAYGRFKAMHIENRGAGRLGVKGVRSDARTQMLV